MAARRDDFTINPRGRFMIQILTFFVAAVFAGWSDGPALPMGSVEYLYAGGGKVVASNGYSAQISDDGGRSWKDVPYPMRELEDSNQSGYRFSFFEGHLFLRKWDEMEDWIWNGSSWTRVDGVGGSLFTGTSSVVLTVGDSSKIFRLAIDSGAGAWAARWTPSGSCAADPISTNPYVLGGSVYCRDKFDTLVGRGHHSENGEFRWDGETLYLVDTRYASGWGVIWSRDSGVTWNRVEQDSLVRSGGLMSQGGVFWHVYRRSWDDSVGMIRRSLNFGANWDTVLVTPVESRADLSSDGKGAFFLQTGSKTLASYDSGATWRGVDSIVSIANVSRVVEDGDRLLVLDRGYYVPSRLWCLKGGKWTVLREDVWDFAVSDGQILAGTEFALYLGTGDGSWEKVLDHDNMGGWSLKRAPDGTWWFARAPFFVHRSVDGRRWDAIGILKDPTDTSTDWAPGYLSAIGLDRDGRMFVATEGVVGRLDTSGTLRRDPRLGYPGRWWISDLEFDRTGLLVGSLDTMVVFWTGSEWKPFRPKAAPGRYERMTSWTESDGRHIAIFGPGRLVVDPDTIGSVGLHEFDWRPAQCGRTSQGLLCFDDHGRSHLLAMRSSGVRHGARTGGFAIRKGVLGVFLEKAGNVRLEILDPKGRMLSSRNLGRMEAGAREIALPRGAAGTTIVRVRLDREVVFSRLAPPGW